MLRIAVAVLLVLAALAAPSAGAPPEKKGQVFKGVIKDLRGIEGVLVLTSKEGAKDKDRTFKISRARIVGLAGAEWKIGDMREGDQVEVEMTRDGGLVQEVRVVAARRKK